MSDPVAMILLTLAVGLIVILGRAGLRRLSRRTPVRPPAEEIARVFKTEVARIERLARRHGPLAVLADDALREPGLTALGTLSVTAPDRESAISALRAAAQRRFSDAIAVGGITALTGTSRWCADAYGLSPRPGPACAVIDGSNVAHWQADHAGGPPSLAPVTAVVTYLQAAGMRPTVIFDANIGYLVSGRHMGNRAMQRQMPAGTKVIVMPRGSPADPAIIARAVKSSAVVISNDAFRDAASPRMILKRKGCYVHGALHLTAARP